MCMMLIFKKINSFVMFGIGGMWSVTIHLPMYFWQAAENLLISLGALAVEQVPRPLSRRGRRKPPDVVSRITPLGRAMACFPVSPRYAKMLSLGHQQGLLPYVVAAVAALSVQEVFVEFHKSSEDVSTMPFCLPDMIMNITGNKSLI